ETGAAAPQFGPSGDEGDAPVAEVDQVAGGAEPAGPVGAADRGHGQVGEADRIDDHDGDVQLVQFRTEIGVQVGGHQHGAVAGAGAHVLQPLPGRTRLAVDGRHRDAAAHAVGGVLDAADDLHRPRAVQVVEDEVEQADPLAPAPFAAGPAAAAAVAAGAQQVLDAFAGLGSHVAPPVEDT